METNYIYKILGHTDFNKGNFSFRYAQKNPSGFVNNSCNYKQENGS